MNCNTFRLDQFFINCWCLIVIDRNQSLIVIEVMTTQNCSLTDTTADGDITEKSFFFFLLFFWQNRSWTRPLSVSSVVCDSIQSQLSEQLTDEIWHKLFRPILIE